MSNKRTGIDLETRLSGAFRSADLPVAPGRLVEVLERVPEAPIARGGAQGDRPGSGRRTIAGLLGVAAILLVGGTLALGVGSRPQTPLPSPSGPLTGEASSSPAPGVLVSYQVGWTDAAPYSAALLAEEVRIAQQRVDATGALGVTVTAVGTDRINVAIPAGVDAEALRSLIGQTGHLAFVPLGDTHLDKGAPVDPTRFPELFGSEAVATATVSTNQSGARVIDFQLTPTAADVFGSYTAAHIGSYFAITLDNVVVTAPVINSEIPGGSVEISQAGTGGWDLAQANEFATIIRLKPLPAPLTEISNGPGPVDPSASPSAVPSPSDPGFALERTPADFGCDSMLPPYRSFVIHIDPSAAEPVWAIADTNARLRVLWGATDRGLGGTKAEIVDASGHVLARDGTRIAIPDGAWPSLLGRFVCPGTDAVYVTDQPAQP